MIEVEHVSKWFGELVAVSDVSFTVGPGVTEFKAGDRGAYAGAVGGYAEERVMPADRLVKLPDGIDYKTGAAMMLQGMTVRYLLRQTYKVGPDTTMLFHAAAGGVGLIACQWARHLGATIIGTVSTSDKAALAKAFFNNLAKPLQVLATPGSSGDVPGYTFPFDRKKATETLEKAGFSKAKPLQMTFCTTNGTFPKQDLTPSGDFADHVCSVAVCLLNLSRRDQLPMPFCGLSNLWFAVPSIVSAFLFCFLTNPKSHILLFLIYALFAVSVCFNLTILHVLVCSDYDSVRQLSSAATAQH